VRVRPQERWARVLRRQEREASPRHPAALEGAGRMDALRSACNFGNTDVVRALLAEQPDAARQGEASLLHEAAAAGHAQVCKLLLEAGASPALLDEDGQTALHHAANEGHADVVRLLAPSPGCGELFVQDKYQMTPYHLACENGHEDTVSHLLKLLDAVPEASEPKATQLRRGSALFLAQKGGHFAVVDMVNSARSSSTEDMSSSRGGSGSSGGGS